MKTNIRTITIFVLLATGGKVINAIPVSEAAKNAIHQVTHLYTQMGIDNIKSVIDEKVAQAKLKLAMFIFNPYVISSAVIGCCIVGLIADYRKRQRESAKKTNQSENCTTNNSIMTK